MKEPDVGVSPAAGFGGSVVRGCTWAGRQLGDGAQVGLRKSEGRLPQADSERLNEGGEVGRGEGTGESDTGAAPSQHWISPRHSTVNSKGQKGSHRGVKEKEAWRKAGT